MTDVRLGFTEIKQACTFFFCAYHTFVILRDPTTGTTFATRAGPSGRGGSYGVIRTNLDRWDETFIDKPSETVHVQRVGSVNGGLAETLGKASEFNAAVDSARIPYNSTGPNSNTYSSQFLKSLGIRGTIPTMVAPGFTDTFGASLPGLPAPGESAVSLSP